MDRGKTFRANPLLINILSNVFPLQQIVICRAFVDLIPLRGILSSLKKIKLSNIQVVDQTIQLIRGIIIDAVTPI